MIWQKRNLLRQILIVSLAWISIGIILTFIYYLFDLTKSSSADFIQNSFWHMSSSIMWIPFTLILVYYLKNRPAHTNTSFFLLFVLGMGIAIAHRFLAFYADFSLRILFDYEFSNLSSLNIIEIIGKVPYAFMGGVMKSFLTYWVILAILILNSRSKSKETIGLLRKPGMIHQELISYFNERLKELKSGSDQYIDRLTIKEGNSIFFIKTEEIEWIKANGNYVTVITKSNEYTIRNSLKNLEKNLNPHNFFRIQKSAIVNINSVVNIEPWFNGNLVANMKRGEQVIIGRKYKGELDRLTTI